MPCHRWFSTGGFGSAVYGLEFWISSEVFAAFPLVFLWQPYFTSIQRKNGGCNSRIFLSRKFGFFLKKGQSISIAFPEMDWRGSAE
jgi:hypothetical protein